MHQSYLGHGGSDSHDLRTDRTPEISSGKSNVTLFLLSKSITKTNTAVIDFCQMFCEIWQRKRGPWASSHTILSIHRAVETITAPCYNWKPNCSAVDEVRKAHYNVTLAPLFQEGIDELDASLFGAVSWNITHQPTDDSADTSDENFNYDLEINGNGNN